MDGKKQQPLKNFNCYLKNGQRVAVFAREDSEGNLNIFELRTSRKDEFSKQVAKHVFNAFEDENYAEYWKIDTNYYHPVQFKIAIEEGNSAKHQFKLFCLGQYYKKYTDKVYIPVESLHKNDEIIVLNKKK